MVETKSEIRKKAWELGHFEGYCQGKEDRDAYWREQIDFLCQICHPEKPCAECKVWLLKTRIDKLLSGGEKAAHSAAVKAVEVGTHPAPHRAMIPTRPNRKGVIKQHQATADEIADTLAEGIVAGVISREEVLKRFPECSSLKETAGLYRKWDKEKKQKGVKP